MQKNQLVVNKIIYAKRVVTTKEQINEVLNLEIETHLRNNPALCFLRVGNVVDNTDRSKTFPLIFDLKVNQINKKAVG